ncbi:hypothetical protein SASPL_103251 [Salvia splendens]|uniref:Ent-copalyl diphosphate synthase n=1 Tax=Salvia splendens TaxID=180675 RepID=A0A8X9AEG0_SALSN|nr:hypothetical protein SASPL_103251 [Salvia splendens]
MALSSYPIAFRLISATSRSGHHSSLSSIFSILRFQNSNTLQITILQHIFNSSDNLPHYNAMPSPNLVHKSGLPVIKWHEIVEDDTEKDSLKREIVTTSDEIAELAGAVRSMLRSMGDGEISVSPYDTAWVALVAAADEAGPQFPSSLEWISRNQLGDGSWGDGRRFSIFDRIINTLACVVALRSWDVNPEKTEKGILFIKKNINRLEEENMEHMPIGFEVALPSLIDKAKELGIDIPSDTRRLREIYARREIKLKKIPKDILHQMPTTLLHSLEGMEVPNVYPVDLFEHLWAVDRLQRLGVSRYFQTEMDECIAYVHWYWTEKGICWARNSEVQDIDDTAMAFRLLRLHGYKVSADVFGHFWSGGEFFCFKGQSTQAVTGMFNLYRAAQLIFPGENILEDAAAFSSKFLHQKRADNELLDKWIITKDLPGEVGYALDVPWYASLPRVETRFYLEQYGGEDDVWIGKTLYRMPYVNNNIYLELAKLDYNNCQALHQQEWKDLQKWCRNSNLGVFGLGEGSLMQAYYVAAASVFEPEKSQERLAWAKTAILMQTITSHFQSTEQKRAFIDEFERDSVLTYANGVRYKTRPNLVGTLLRTLNQLSLDILLAQGCNIHQPLKNAWHKWMKTWEGGGGRDAELLVQTLNLSGRVRTESEELPLFHPKYDYLMKAAVSVCDKLHQFQHRKDGNGCMASARGITTLDIESAMQELVKLVVTKSAGDLDSQIKQNFFIIARSFYYSAYCNIGTINFHISKVLFERVQ